MKKTLLTLVAGAALLLATACGTSQPSTSDSSKGAAGEKITVTDDAGRTVRLDGPATRVVSLEWQQTEDLLTLGVKPVAVADKKGYDAWVSAEKLPGDTVDVGTRQEPNLEAIFSEDPDLVIVEAKRGDPVIKQLEKYKVPVLVTTGADGKDSIGQMKKTFTMIAKTTGKTAEAEKVLKDFDKKVAEATAAVKKLPASGRRFLYLDAYIEGSNVTIRPFGKGSLIGDLGTEIGLENAWAGKVDDLYGLGATDVEGITEVKDATVFYTGTGSEEEAGGSAPWLPALEKNSLWSNASFVKEGKLKAFPDGVWTFGGPRSSEQVIDAFLSGLK